MKELRSKVGNAGFEIIRTTSFVSMLLPVMTISRLMGRRDGGEYDVMAELRIKKGVNVLLKKILDMERYAIRLGVDFPFGGSLLLIARKK